MLYTSQHLSLACVEILVHLDKSQLPFDYVWSSSQLPSAPGALSVPDLRSISSCQRAGREWLTGREQLAVQVPSVVIPDESNILLNPAHSGYHDLNWSEPRPFRFDPRLFVAEPQTL
jgi:RES domain-containing protein